MNEDQLIQTFFQQTNIDDKSVIIGIGDDAAIMEVPEAYQIVISTDTLLSGRHFPANYPATELASRAVGVCVSDLAAMGAIPKWVTLSLCIPTVEQVWIDEFSQSLHQSLRAYSMSLVGGDTVQGSLAISLSVIGIVETGLALRRDTARIDDDIYVSGSLGGSAFALFRILANEPDRDNVMHLFSKPEARITLGRSLINLASACMDVSDGILLDLSRLVDKSDVGAEVYLEKFPLHPAINDFPLETQIKFATSGDDYELLFTASANNREKIKKIEKDLNLPLTRIGKVTKDKTLKTLSNGRLFDVKKHGYQHFD